MIRLTGKREEKSVFSRPMQKGKGFQCTGHFDRQAGGGHNKVSIDTLKVSSSRAGCTDCLTPCSVEWTPARTHQPSWTHPFCSQVCPHPQPQRGPAAAAQGPPCTRHPITIQGAVQLREVLLLRKPPRSSSYPPSRPCLAIDLLGDRCCWLALSHPSSSALHDLSLPCSLRRPTSLYCSLFLRHPTIS